MRKVSDLESFREVMENEKLKEVLLSLEKISGISTEEKIKPVEFYNKICFLESDLPNL
jgi:hypothetical protein